MSLIQPRRCSRQARADTVSSGQPDSRAFQAWSSPKALRQVYSPPPQQQGHRQHQGAQPGKEHGDEGDLEGAHQVVPAIRAKIRSTAAVNCRCSSAWLTGC